MLVMRGVVLYDTRFNFNAGGLMTFSTIAQQQAVADSILALVSAMNVGLAPIAFQGGGGLEYGPMEASVEAPPSLLLPPSRMSFHGADAPVQRRPELDAMLRAATESGDTGEVFVDIYEDLQAALTVDGALIRDEKGRLRGSVGELLDNLSWRDVYAARALVAEYDARSHNEGMGPGPFRAADMWLDYAVYSKLRGPFRRHVFSRSIWNATASGEWGFAARAHTLSAHAYLGDSHQDVEEGLLEMLRAAAFGVRGDFRIGDVHRNFAVVTEGWRQLLGERAGSHLYFRDALDIFNALTILGNR